MPFSPSKKKKRRSRLTVATLTLTSMMDMFTIILLFLLKSYSAEGDILTADPKLKLPVATSKVPSKMKLIIQITNEEIMVDFFFFNDTATTEIYTLSLHDALPI